MEVVVLELDPRSNSQVHHQKRKKLKNRLVGLVRIEQRGSILKVQES